MTKTSPLEAVQIEGFSEYSIEKELSSGNYGRVYQIRHIATGQQYACKFVQKSSLSPRQISCTRYEMGLLGKLNHKNVVRLHKAIETADYLMMVMDLMKGGDLLDRLESQGVFSESLAREVLLQIATGIKYIHDMGVAHRDIKVENIMFASPDSCEIKLADFGLSKMIGRTPTHTPVGTPHYMAPEIARRTAHSTNVDIWSFGCVAYVILFGCFPFHEKNKDKQGDEGHHEEFPGLREKISAGVFSFPKGIKVSKEVRDLISKTLVVDPAERLNIDEVLDHPWFKIALSPPSPLGSKATKSSSFKDLFRFGLKAERQRIEKLEATPEDELQEQLQEELDDKLRDHKISFFSVLSSKLIKKRDESKSRNSSRRNSFDESKNNSRRNSQDGGSKSRRNSVDEARGIFLEDSPVM